jgi:hypothetical protein
MEELYRVRLIGKDYAKLNGDGYVASETTRRPYRHAITAKGTKAVGGPLAIEEEPAERRSARERQLWAAIVAQQHEIVRLRARGNGATPTVAAEPVDLDFRIRAAYTKLADAPGDYVELTELRPLISGVSKAELDKALVRLHDAPDVRLEPEPFGHRIGAEERAAAVHIGGEDRHKLAVGLR